MKTQVSVSDIKLMLKNKYKLNIDSIAKVRFLFVGSSQRDSIAKFASRYGVNKSKMETLLVLPRMACQYLLAMILSDWLI